jgi:serine/threonine-protein kinase
LVEKAPRATSKALPEELPAALQARFESVELLGQGGMGTVYRARDRRLGRDVAIKIIHGVGDPKTAWRFLQEVRSQASIEHEHVCKIYEVGGAERTHFIVMQLIHGEPLDIAKERMTTEQKVKVVKEAAAALHEAHRAGFIHRDIKPGNIMIERGEDGSCKPYVMDFGLARELEAWGQTMTGAIAGTPAFMAPEQARGEIRALDRRTDVYSLGATLYDLLAGRPPFKSSSLIELLRRVGHEEAPPLRQVNREIPEDLETIVMKCLEREPHRRYDSARALAEDLARYLDGEPLNARRASLGYVLLKKARKHKLAVFLATAALLAATLVATLWFRANRLAAEQARLSQELGADVKEMELFMRYAHGLPAHDIEQEHEVVRARLRGIEARMARMGRAADGPGQYALGRGYLSLQEPEAALEHLRLAAAAGYASPDHSYAMGRALGEVYRKALEATRRISDPEQKKARIQQIEADYRDPALQHLRAAAGVELEAPEYVEGLIAFYEGKHDEALKKAREALARAPWLYEAEVLVGDTHYAVGSQWRPDSAFDYDKMMAHFTPAAEAYRRAASMARSDPAVHEAECELGFHFLSADGRRGVSPRDSFERAKPACDQAVLTSSKRGSSHTKRVMVYAGFAHYPGAESPQTMRDVFAKTIELAEQAANKNPDDAMAQWVLGFTWFSLLNAGGTLEHDPLQAVDKGIIAYTRALALDPQFLWATRELGVMYWWKAAEENERGVDAIPSLERALEQYARTVALAPSSFKNYRLDACYALWVWVQVLVARGERPDAVVERAIPACEAGKAQGIPNHNLDEALGWIYIHKARYELDAGIDPSASIDSALQSLGAAEKIRACNCLPQMRAIAYGLAAQRAMEQGEDPEPSLRKAREAFPKSVDALPGCIHPSLAHQPPVVRAELDLIGIRWAMKKGKATAGHFEAALDLVRPRQDAEPFDAARYRVTAEIHEQRALWLLERNREPDEDIDRGLALAEKALSRYARMARALAVRGRLYLLRARAAREPSARAEAARLAKASLEAAFRANPLLERKHEQAMREAERLMDEKKNGAERRNRGAR